MRLVIESAIRENPNKRFEHLPKISIQIDGNSFREFKEIVINNLQKKCRELSLTFSTVAFFLKFKNDNLSWIILVASFLAGCFAFKTSLRTIVPSPTATNKSSIFFFLNVSRQDSKSFSTNSYPSFLKVLDKIQLKIEDIRKKNQLVNKNWIQLKYYLLKSRKCLESNQKI